VIGSGAFSTVLLVTDRARARDYACKVVSRAALMQSGTFHRCEQEIRLLERMRHPHIVSVVEVIYRDAAIFVVMEHCAGGELFQYLVAHGRLREAECRQLFAGVVDAVAYLHAHGVAHRDLKPENILLTERFEAKIADLGLCHLVGPDALLTTPCGSPQYAAPEVFAGRGYDGRASDVWSLGVVLFVMATATVPWRSTAAPALFREISLGAYTVPPFLSPSLRALIRRMMNTVAAARPTIADVARDPWLLSEDEGVFAPQGLVKAVSVDMTSAPRARKPDPRASGRVLLVRPAMPPSTSVNAGKGKAAVPLDALLRRVPPSGRGKPPGLQRIPAG
jgi:carbon catabolite-derepressing protein kinase